MLTLTDELYLDIINDININGDSHDNDRTGVGTKRVFGRMFKFDLEKEFPIVTLKPCAFKNTVRELLFFLNGDDHLKYLEKLGGSCIKWWEPFKKEDNTIGPLYPTQWRNLEVDKSTRQAIPIKRKVCKDSNYKAPVFIKETSIDGVTYQSSKSGDFIIVDKTKEALDKQYKYTIQFLYTGYKKYNVQKSNILKGEVNNPYFPRVAGVGFIGEEKLDNDLKRNLYKVWVSMLHRCYNPQNKKYAMYGANGVFVDSRWFNFSNFLEDAKLLPGWFNKRKYLNSYQLDKDYFGSSGYSKDTCIWLLKSDNNIYTSKSQPFKVVNTFTDDVYIDISIREFATKHNLTYQSCQQCLNKKQKTTKGYKFEYLNYDTNNFVYRYPLPVDQIQNCIDLIKTNPGSRRICFTGWNPQDLYKQNLYACHSSFVQFMVCKNNKLHMSAVQR